MHGSEEVTCERGTSRLYVNGKLEGLSPSASAPLAIKSPAKMWVGGWYNHFQFVGDMDEVRISKVARSADWIKLEYENQRANQTLVGTLSQPGNEFGVSPERMAALTFCDVPVSPCSALSRRVQALERDLRHLGSTQAGWMVRFSRP